MDEEDKDEMKTYEFHFKDGRLETGKGWSGLDAWQRLGHDTYWWCMLSYAQEI
jgi:hypothetical protein